MLGSNLALGLNASPPQTRIAPNSKLPPHHCHIGLITWLEYEPAWGSGPSMDYYSVIADAISRSASKSDEARCAIYERARTALREALCDYERPVLANEQVALETAVCRLEAELVLREAS
jgi:hypothetical protein